jgi:hypothetical protein
VLALIDLGDSDPELLDVYLSALDERSEAIRRPVATPAQPAPTGKRPLAPAASRAEVNAFFTKGR